MAADRNADNEERWDGRDRDEPEVDGEAADEQPREEVSGDGDPERESPPGETAQEDDGREDPAPGDETGEGDGVDGPAGREREPDSLAEKRGREDGDESPAGGDEEEPRAEGSEPEDEDGDDSVHHGADEPVDEPGAHRPARSGAAAGAGAAMAERAAAPPEELSSDSFGSWLRRQREIREIDLREIAEQTKISLRYLKAMEQDRFDVLPAEVFAKGFLREYARYVGLNPDEVVNYYLASHEGAGDGEDPVEAGSMTTESRGPVSLRLLAGLVLLLVLAAAAYYWFYQQSRDGGDAGENGAASSTAAETPSSQPPPEPPPEPEPEPDSGSSAPLVVTLDFTQNCWVEARADDERTVSRLFATGESLQLEAQEQVVLETLGNVEGVQVQVNGEPYELPPSRGNTVSDVVIEAPEPPSPPARSRRASPATGGAGTGNPGTGNSASGNSASGNAGGTATGNGNGGPGNGGGDNPGAPAPLGAPGP